jgi:phosphoribosyl-ATP pyrophosphohydrolase
LCNGLSFLYEITIAITKTIINSTAKINCPVENISDFFLQKYDFIVYFFLFSKDKTMTMKKQLNAVNQFHNAFGLGVSDKIIGDLGATKNLLRFNLMKEENEEYYEAVQKNDVIEIADALGDMLYVLCGTILEHGLHHKIEEVFDEIQRSNMSKLDHDGKPIYREDGKVIKGPNYFKPNLNTILK